MNLIDPQHDPEEPAAAPAPGTAGAKFVSRLPHKPGVYIMRDKTGAILYIGKAIDLRKRVSNYFRSDVDIKIRALVREIRHVDFVTAASEREALLIEQRLIHRHQPNYNTMWRDDKSYPFVKISLNEDFPRVTLTRKRRKDGAKYYGPFTHVLPVKKLLRWIWTRHLFPLRPCTWEFSESKPLKRSTAESCLYLHTGDCPAPCVGKISRKNYAAIARDAVDFFEGRHARLRKAWETEMKAASDAMDFEKAAQMRDNLAAIAEMRQPVTFRALNPDDVQSRISSSRALQELQTALNLPKPPVRIEAFDISHSQGVETVASMVTFDRGKPLKSHYRKFIIRTVAGVDDFASMEEVIARRYKRVLEEKLRWPDLILIDGGPGQLSSAMKALKKLGLGRVSIASLAKQEEEIFLPNRKDPVRLPKTSPALQVLQHLRDESHRFAITFHRSRRDKTIYTRAEAASPPESQEKPA